MNNCINIDFEAFLAILPFGSCCLVGDQTRSLACSLFCFDGWWFCSARDRPFPRSSNLCSFTFCWPCCKWLACSFRTDVWQSLKASCLTNFPPLREELKRHNDESINSAVTKIRLENSARHSFKSKGNEEQYNHQEKVAPHFDSAIESLHSGKLLEARNVLGDGKNIVATRMKHIVLADLHGWDFFTEYKQIPLPEDKSNEKGFASF